MEYRYFNVLCEGQTEVSFVKKLLAPYLESDNIFLKPMVLGGVSKYSFNCCEGMTNKMIQQLKHIRKRYETPELINNSEQTAPSKRILNIYGEYQKVVDGMAIAEAIGIENMIKECSHFAKWINLLRGKNN